MQLSERDIRRFWSKVALPNEQGCMLWLGRPNPDGYGRFRIGGRSGTTPGAHRVSYELAYGPIPEGLQVDHVKARGCTNRHCVAPLHLEAVTSAENTRRGDLNSRRKSKTQCLRDHAYDAVNTHVDRRGKRNCRTCNRERARRNRARA